MWARREHAFLGQPVESLRYMAVCRAFAIGVVVHLGLPEAQSLPWLVPNACAAIGALVLAIRGAPAGWLLALLGLTAPLLFLRDQLTQSVFLAAVAAAALAAFTGSRRERAARMATMFPAAVRALTVAVYGLAALHKLNASFFDPELSCANAGLRVLAENWSLVSDAQAQDGPAFLSALVESPLLPVVFIAAEILVAALLVLRPGRALLLAPVLHLPLTIVFAPAFAFTLLPGWIASLSEDELAHLGAVFRRRFTWIVGIGLGLALASFALYLRAHHVLYPLWQLKEAALFVAFAWVVIAAIDARRGDAREEILPARLLLTDLAPRQRWLPVIALGLAVMNGLTPYLGLQMHHAGAMLSNLRIDDDCWNSLWAPKTARVIDPYVYVEDARVTGRPDSAALEAFLETTLSTPAGFHERRKVYCASGRIALVGTVHGARFATEDLCSDWPLRRPAVPGFRAFQINLERSCNAGCIH